MTQPSKTLLLFTLFIGWGLLYLFYLIPLFHIPLVPYPEHPESALIHLLAILGPIFVLGFLMPKG